MFNRCLVLSMCNNDDTNFICGSVYIIRDKLKCLFSSSTFSENFIIASLIVVVVLPLLLLNIDTGLELVLVLCEFIVALLLYTNRYALYY